MGTKEGTLTEDEEASTRSRVFTPDAVEAAAAGRDRRDIEPAGIGGGNELPGVASSFFGTTVMSISISGGGSGRFRLVKNGRVVLPSPTPKLSQIVTAVSSPSPRNKTC
jgi:hypothetical protein